MRALACFSVICLGAAAPAGAADDVLVEAAWREEALEVTCTALIDAPPDVIWGTLTDYNRLADFIPGMRRSRVLSQNGAVTVVEQAGEARFLFFSIPIEATVSSTERPPYAIEARLLRGNLKRLEGAYGIEPRAAGRSLLSWRGVIQAEPMPPLFGEMLLRSTIEDQFRGMVREIERREARRREVQAGARK
jgi:carbon monoxide dehydrogenase subunit G